MCKPELNTFPKCVKHQEDSTIKMMAKCVIIVAPQEAEGEITNLRIVCTTRQDAVSEGGECLVKEDLSRT